MPKARSVCESPTVAGQVLVGTRSGEIIEIGGQRTHVLMRSHFDGELWGLAPHPTNPEFITIGRDSMLAIWDVKTRRQKKFAKLDCETEEVCKARLRRRRSCLHKRWS